MTVTIVTVIFIMHFFEKNTIFVNDVKIRFTLTIFFTSKVTLPQKQF
jgi:hypothetical protein